MAAPSPFLLIRVDDRLLHGQVTLGWGSRLHPEAYLIVDRWLASHPDEAELYRLASPPESDVRILGPEAFLGDLRSGAAWPRSVLLLRDLETLRDLVRGGFRPLEVNLGGIHGHEASREILPYLHLAPADWAVLEELVDLGVQPYAQDLPGSPRRGWDWLRRHRPRP
jgi:mannose/fructose/N-acetylgalactosamine-specific phosphotransferase system component IIB